MSFSLDMQRQCSDLKNRFKIEELLIVGILIGFLFPLSTNLGITKVVTWNIPAAILLFLIILRGINRKTFHIHSFDIWDYSILAIIFIYYVMTLLGENFGANISFLNSYIYCLILAIYFRRNYGTLFTTQALIIFAFLSIGLESIIGLIQQITSSEFGNLAVYIGETPDSSNLRSIGETDMGRVHGTLGTGNLVGSWINMFLPFILYASVFIKNKRLWIWQSLAVIISIIAIILTISRFNIALFVGILLFSFFVYFFTHYKGRIRLKIRTSVFAFVSVLVIISAVLTVNYWAQIGLMKEAVELRFSGTFDPASESGDQSSGVAARMEMNKGALQAFVRSPLIGLGYKNSRWIWPSVDADVPRNWVYQPHNLYMIMLVEGGIFLFIAYLIFTLYPFYRMWQVRHTKDPFLLAFFLSLGASMGIQMIYITFTTHSFAAVYMMLQGCAMGYMDQYLKQRKVV